ncbi:MAG: UDP-glucose/GDP-mannose dehydrogenase family protein, partial [bacterium]|nr:UDP-glucose/GDP-mannose dehydrogenase family protein [bacterium]
AEISKLALNSFVTTKITFANELARLCEQMPGAEVDAITDAIGLDSRIGPKYLTGGAPFGGPCFPFDNRALLAAARRAGCGFELAEVVDRLNGEHLVRIESLVRSKLPPRGTTGILGLAYKPECDVVESSAGILLVRRLAASGDSVVAYDPAALENARQLVGDAVQLVNSAAECVRRADVVVVATPWKEFRDIDAPAEDGKPGRVFLDCWRILDRDRIQPQAEYVPLGTGKLGSQGLDHPHQSIG